MHQKFSLITLPCQSGKTFQTITVMNDEISQDATKGRSLHIVYTINTLLNEIQFTSRLRGMAHEHKVKVLVISSKNQIPHTDEDVFLHTKNVEGAIGLIAMHNVGVVVMCNNRNRIASQMTLMHHLDSLKQDAKSVKRCFVYYDEIHKYIDSYTNKIQPLREQISELCEFEVVQKVFGITATPHNVYQRGTRWEQLNQLTYVKPKIDTYASLEGSKHTTIECDSDGSDPDDDDPEGDDDESSSSGDPNGGDEGVVDSAVKYAKHVIEGNPHILGHGARVFIPGLTKRKSHSAIRAMVLRHNPQCVVVTLNGVEKTLAYLKDDRVQEAEAAAEEGKVLNLVSRLTRVNLTSKDSLAEVSDVVAGVLAERGLGHKPLVFTGMLCVSVGQTLTNKGFGTFTSMIVSPAASSKHDAIYQLMGRATGQTKEWDTFNRTEVFCTPETLKVGLAMEKAAEGMMALSGESVSLEQYEAFLKDAGVKPKRKQRPRAKKPKLAVATEPQTVDDVTYPIITTASNPNTQLPSSAKGAVVGTPIPMLHAVQ